MGDGGGKQRGPASGRGSGPRGVLKRGQGGWRCWTAHSRGSGAALRGSGRQSQRAALWRAGRRRSLQTWDRALASRCKTWAMQPAKFEKARVRFNAWALNPVAATPCSRAYLQLQSGRHAMKRIALFLLTNLAVMLVLGLAVNLLGVEPVPHRQWAGPRRPARLCGRDGLLAVRSSRSHEQADGQVDDAAGDHQRLQPPDARLDRQRGGALRARPASRRPRSGSTKAAQCLATGRSRTRRWWLSRRACWRA